MLVRTKHDRNLKPTVPCIKYAVSKVRKNTKLKELHELRCSNQRHIVGAEGGGDSARRKARCFEGIINGELVSSFQKLPLSRTSYPLRHLSTFDKLMYLLPTHSGGLQQPKGSAKMASLADSQARKADADLAEANSASQRD